MFVRTPEPPIQLCVGRRAPRPPRGARLHRPSRPHARGAGHARSARRFASSAGAPGAATDVPPGGARSSNEARSTTAARRRSGASATLPRDCEQAAFVPPAPALRPLDARQDPQAAAALEHLDCALVARPAPRFRRAFRPASPRAGPSAQASWTMSAPPTSSPATKTCGIVGQSDSAESSSRMRGREGRRPWRSRLRPRSACSARSELPQ